MKQLLTLLFLLLLAQGAFAQAQTDSLLYAPLTSAVSATTYGVSGSFVLTYPSEISVLWNRNPSVGRDVDSVWFERYDRISDSWHKLRFYQEQTGSYDTILVRDRPVTFIVPVHALPIHVRLNTGGTQTDTVKVQWRRN